MLTTRILCSRVAFARSVNLLCRVINNKWLLNVSNGSVHKFIAYKVRVCTNSLFKKLNAVTDNTSFIDFFVH